MKLLSLFLILLPLQLFPMEKPSAKEVDWKKINPTELDKLNEKIKKEQEEVSTHSKISTQKFIDFEKYVQKSPLYTLEAAKNEFPEIFEHLLPFQEKVLFKYAQYSSNNNPYKFLNELKKNEEKLRIFKWRALAYSYELDSYFSEKDHYLLFLPFLGKKVLFLGTRFETENLTDYLGLELEAAALAPKLSSIEEKIKNMEKINKTYEELVKLESEKHKLTPLEKEKQKKYKDTLEKYLTDKELILLQKNLLRRKQHELVLHLEQKYKIHLMPQGDLTPSLGLLLDAAKTYKDLQKLLVRIKARPGAYKTSDGVTQARIVIYVSAGKENVQKALDKLYYIFKDSGIKGLNEAPRYNAKVTDLIYVAQGDGDLKTDKFSSFYEPGRIYYHPYFSGTPKDYHLKHPETGKELIS